MEARRLAARLLQDHAKDGPFNVWIADSDDLDLIAQRLREFGCDVLVNPTKREIEVDPPPHLELRESRGLHLFKRS